MSRARLALVVEAARRLGSELEQRLCSQHPATVACYQQWLAQSPTRLSASAFSFAAGQILALGTAVHGQFWQRTAPVDPPLGALIRLAQSPDLACLLTEELAPLEHACAEAKDLGDSYPQLLHAADPQARRLRGVYYTPQPVARFLVAAVDELLRTHFGLNDGLASRQTWAQVRARLPWLDCPQRVTGDTPFVRIVDPAAGTGVFLRETVRFLCCHDGSVDDQALGARLAGIEIMPVPCALAQLELGPPTVAWGNALLAQSRSRAAQWLKPGAGPIVVFNPPYAKRSANCGAHAESLVRPLKQAVFGERNLQPLSDDYIKFVALAMQSKAPVIAMVTNRTYLTGLLHRGLRHHLLEQYRLIYVIDLHGDGLLDARSGAADENIFGITQGVALGIFCVSGEPPVVHYGELRGSRESKLEALATGSLKLASQRLVPAGPQCFFSPRNLGPRREQTNWPALPELFSHTTMGIKTRRDHFLLAFTRDELAQRMQMLADCRNLERLRTSLGVRDTAQWTLSGMQQLVRSQGVTGPIRPIAYRPFDTRFIWYHPRAIERGDARWPLMQLLTDQSVSMVSSRQTAQQCFTSAFVVRGLVEMKLAESTRGSSVFASELLDSRQAARLQQACGVDPRDALYYIYALLHAPSYRTRYRELLRIDYPRIPLELPAGLASELVRLGKRLVACHLLDEPDANAPACVIHDPHVQGRVVRLDGQRLYVNRDSYVEPVSQQAWDLVIGGYHACRHWLLARSGRSLSQPDWQHLSWMIAALEQTVVLMRGIDRAIEDCGGWQALVGSNQVMAPAALQPL